MAQRIAKDIRRLSDVASIGRLPAPAKGNKVYYDDDVAGFGVRVTAKGAKAFIFNYRTKAGRERRITIGRDPNWTIGAARAKAKQLRRLVDDGGDPLGDIAEVRAAPTVADLCDRFIAEHLPKKRPSTVDAYQRILKLHVRPHFGAHTKVADVRFEDIDKLHGAVSKNGGPYIANRTVAVLGKMFSLAIRWHMRADNPVKGIERNSESKRKRYLSGEELAALTAALATHPDKQIANIIRVLLLTGARRGEVLAMRWDDVELNKKDEKGNDIGVWTKPGSTTKQKTDHVVPLSAPARQLLSEIGDALGKRPRGEYVFPGGGETGHVVAIKKGWASLCKAAGINGLRIHDLRHSFASQLASSGASLPLIGALLGHSNPATTARYAHLFDDPQRAAVERVGAIIGAAGKGAKKPAEFPAPKGGRARR
jgi:integrase